MDLASDFVKAREKDLLDQSPGAAMMRSADRQADNEESKALQQRMDKAMQDSGIEQNPNAPSKEAYDYSEAVNSGNNLMSADPDNRQNVVLNNKNFNPYHITVAGMDMATGDNIWGRYADPDGQIGAGVSELRDSKISLAWGRPVADAPALSKVADGMFRQGATYDEFKRETADWPEVSKKAAWNAAHRGFIRQEALSQLEDVSSVAEATGLLPEDETVLPELETAINPDTLHTNPEWMQANAILYEWLTGEKFEGNAMDLDSWGKTQMGLFNWNQSFMGMLVARAAFADDNQKWALYKTMQIYDSLDKSWGGAGRAVMGIATDPTTYFTFGLGTLGTKAASVATKNLIKQLIAGAASGAVGGAVFSSLDDAFRQSVTMMAGEQDQYDFGETAVVAGLGLGMGSVLGGAGGAAATDEVAKMGKKLMTKARGAWDETTQAMKALAMDEAGRIEIRSTRQPTGEITQEMISTGVTIADAMKEPRSLNDAIAAVKIMDGLPDTTISPEAFRPNLYTPREIRQAFQRWKLSPEDQKLTTKWKAITQYGLSCMHANKKTGLSVDFSTSCPRRTTGKGACPYCYVESKRVYKEQTGKKLFATNPKNISENDYAGEVMEMGDSLIKELNRDGGLRLFSFGDFRPDVDDANITRLLGDAEKKGLYVKAITKSPEFIERFADNPNLRINLSIDPLPRAMSNSVTLAEAVALKADRPNVKIRSIAFTEEEAIKQLENPLIDVVTLYNGLVKEKLVAIVKAQNPQIFKDMGEKEVTDYLMTWRAIGKKTGNKNTVAKRLGKKYANKICCTGGHCAGDKAKCGFGLGAMLIMGVHLPDIDDDPNQLTTDEWLGQNNGNS